ncbi:hypothetical protein BOX15_Mlig005309g2 [Macrostomum lignano]|uniref:Alpha-1,3-mannosyl-glycoprotein 2-beta-N-acetylglucosaminyltransferase n=3 Tax=Macrostomum lignano TaxID=282301 RepID=A0A1I8J7Y5_9PLAT|nr:hypothetical protein BOX15_Mlig005309g2 [Macrostomum lignano]
MMKQIIIYVRRLPWRWIFSIGLALWFVLAIWLILLNHSALQRNALDIQGTLIPVPALPEQNISFKSNQQTGSPESVAVLLLACNRPAAVQRSLSKLLEHRPSGWESNYPIIVSMDCAHSATESVVSRFSSQLAGVLRQPDRKRIKTALRERHLIGYYKISRHFKWALDQVFLHLNYTAAIVVEDDLDIAPDFYAYFRHLSPLLIRDPSVWCISAWNDNGKASLIDANRPDLFHRTEFFPGLGWMLLRSLWLELRRQWPAAYWDDHLRKPAIRRGRACIRPEVSRSYTFGRIGVSHGQHFDRFLRHIVLHNSSSDVRYDLMGLDHLTRQAYDAQFSALVYGLPLAASPAEALVMPLPTSSQLNNRNFTIGLLDRPAVRIEYSSRDQFVAAAKLLGSMSDFKQGVPRCGYQGVVSVFQAGRRIFLAPKLPWNGYVTAWNN